MASGVDVEHRPAQVRTLADTGLPSGDGHANQGRLSLDRGSSLGRYVILERLGTGGMGIVYAAYDPELDRKVALKLLRRDAAGQSLGSEGRARLLREARAMARLTHPNVVAVHDIGLAEDAVFVAMEFVDGKTLRDWMHDGPHPWREVVDVFRAAGRGLAAAHAAEMVHRDFKPDNVMVTRQDDEIDRVLVMDFGLVRGAEDPPESDPSTDSAPKPIESSVSASGSGTLTRTGALLGTPAYMAPEQHLSLPTDGRTDQFSFCLALYEALYGQRPFRGDTPAALAFQVTQGELVDPPRDSAVPAWVRRIVLRGLSSEPDDRYPTMDALLADLARDPAVRRRRWFAAAGVVGLVAATGLVVRVASTAEPPCRGSHDRVASVWNDDARTRIRDGLEATGLPYAGTTIEHVLPRLDDYADSWAAQHEDACLATHQRQEQSASLLDLRMMCLDQRLRGLDAVVEVLAQADAETAENAMTAVDSLEPLAGCADARALTAKTPPPTDPQQRQRLRALTAELARAKATAAVGHYRPALDEARRLDDAAQQLGYGPLIADVRLYLGSWQADVGELEAARETLLSAYTYARAHGADSDSAQAARLLAWLLGVTLEQPDRGLDWVAIGRADIGRVDTTGRVQAVLLDTEGSVLDAAGRAEEAVERFRAARDLLEGSEDGRPSDRARVDNNLAAALYSLRRFDEAARHYGAALAVFEEVLGAYHPWTAMAMSNLAMVERRRGKRAHARDLYLRALEGKQATLGPDHVSVAKTLLGLGNLLTEMGQPTAALPRLQRAHDIMASQLEPGHEDLAWIVNSLGLAQCRAGLPHAAQQHLDRALDVFADDPDRAYVLEDLGECALLRGQPQQALEHYADAVHIREASVGPDDPSLAGPLRGWGVARIATGRPADAVEALERSLRLQREGDDPGLLAETRFALAQALSSIGEHERARRLAAQALDGSADSPRLDEASVSEWLARHAP